jgi:transcriptional antiterminator NusG
LGVLENENTTDLTQHWYVIYTYSGYENKVKATLEKIVANRGLQDKISEIIIPMEEEIEIKDGKQKTSIKKVFPGYVLIKMIMTDETWYVVNNIKGVFNFVGVGDKPLPLTESEMQSLGIEEVVNLDFDIGDTVRIITEPFYNYLAVIEEIYKDKNRVKVKVDMFGRETMMDLDFNQIQKI